MAVRRLSLAYRDLEDVPDSLIAKWAPTLQELDLSNNRLKEVGFLRGLTALETLVLDGNRLTHQTRFPPLARLRTLWVNRNAIALLPTFLGRLADAHLPLLRFLSLLGNSACPNYLSAGSLKQYRDYRLFVLSRFPLLEMLDDAAVTDEERQEAVRLYGTLDLSSAEAMYKRQTQQQDSHQASTATDTSLATTTTGDQKHKGSRQKKGKKPTPRKAKGAPADGVPPDSTRSEQQQAASTATTPSKGEKQVGEEPFAISREPSSPAAGAEGEDSRLPPTAIALPSLAKSGKATKKVEPLLPVKEEEEEEEEEGPPGPYVVDELPDPLTGFGIPPPPPHERDDEDDDDDDDSSEWTDDDIEVESEILDLPDFSSSPDDH